MHILKGSFTIGIAYNQFMVWDDSVALPGCDWTENHFQQGFARRESTVNFGTLIEFGVATVRVYEGRYVARPEYGRVIAVPLLASTGLLRVEGPEDDGIDDYGCEQRVRVEAGDYRLVAAQRRVGECDLEVWLYAERQTSALRTSEILVADESLSFVDPLVEDAGIA